MEVTETSISNCLVIRPFQEFVVTLPMYAKVVLLKKSPYIVLF